MQIYTYLMLTATSNNFFIIFLNFLCQAIQLQTSFLFLFVDRYMLQVELPPSFLHFVLSLMHTATYTFSSLQDCLYTTDVYNAGLTHFYNDFPNRQVLDSASHILPMLYRCSLKRNEREKSKINEGKQRFLKKKAATVCTQSHRYDHRHQLAVVDIYEGILQGIALGVLENGVVSVQERKTRRRQTITHHITEDDKRFLLISSPSLLMFMASVSILPFPTGIGKDIYNI